MANSLNRNLEIGDKIVLDGYVVAEVSALTFGAMAFTSGCALGVTVNGVPKTVDGHSILVEETERRFPTPEQRRDRAKDIMRDATNPPDTSSDFDDWVAGPPLP